MSTRLSQRLVPISALFLPAVMATGLMPAGTVAVPTGRAPANVTAHATSLPEPQLVATSAVSAPMVASGPQGAVRPGLAMAWKVAYKTSNFSFTGSAAGNGVPRVSCATPTLCVLPVSAAGGAVTFLVGNPRTGTFGATAALPASAAVLSIQQVSCPTSKLCVAMDGSGNVFYTTDPAPRAHWSRTATGLLAQATSTWDLDCPSAKLCLIGTDGGEGGPALWTSLNPQVPGSWHQTNLPNGAEVVALSCLSTHFCLAVGSTPTSTGPSDVWLSTAPASGRWTDTRASVGGRPVAGGVSCPAAKFCVIASSGNVVQSSDPSSGRWATADVAALRKLNAFEAPGIGDLSCPSPALCVGALPNGNGKVAISTDPRAGRWSVQVASHAYEVASVTCLSKQECVAVGVPLNGSEGLAVLTGAE